MIRIDARNLHARRQAQGLRDARGSGAPDVFLRDDKDRRGCLLNLLRVLGNGGDLHVAELFQAQLLERHITLGFVGSRPPSSSEREPRARTADRDYPQPQDAEPSTFVEAPARVGTTTRWPPTRT